MERQSRLSGTPLVRVSLLALWAQYVRPYIMGCIVFVYSLPMPTCLWRTVGYVVGLLCNLQSNHSFHLSKSKATRGNVAGFVASHAVNYLMEIGFVQPFLWLNVSKWLAPILVMVAAVPINFLLLNGV